MGKRTQKCTAPGCTHQQDAGVPSSHLGIGQLHWVPKSVWSDISSWRSRCWAWGIPTAAPWCIAAGGGVGGGGRGRICLWLAGPSASISEGLWPTLPSHGPHLPSTVQRILKEQPWSALKILPRWATASFGATILYWFSFCFWTLHSLVKLMGTMSVLPTKSTDTQFHILTISGVIGFWCPSVRDQRPSFKNSSPRCSPTPRFPTCIWNKIFLLLPKQKQYPERNYRALQPEANLSGDIVHLPTSRQHWTACSPRKSPLRGGESAIPCIWKFFLTLHLSHSCLKINPPSLLGKQEHKCSFWKWIRVPSSIPSCKINRLLAYYPN